MKLLANCLIAIALCVAFFLSVVHLSIGNAIASAFYGVLGTALLFIGFPALITTDGIKIGVRKRARLGADFSLITEQHSEKRVPYLPDNCHDEGCFCGIGAC